MSPHASCDGAHAPPMRDDRIKLAKPDGPCIVFEIREQLSSTPDVRREALARRASRTRRRGSHPRCSEQGSQGPTQVPRSVAAAHRATAATARIFERRPRAMAASALPKRPIRGHPSRCEGQSGLGHREADHPPSSCEDAFFFDATTAAPSKPRLLRAGGPPELTEWHFAKAVGSLSSA